MQMSRLSEVAWWQSRDGLIAFVLDSIIQRLKRKRGSAVGVDVWGEDPCRYRQWFFGKRPDHVSVSEWPRELLPPPLPAPPLLTTCGGATAVLPQVCG